VARKVSWVTAVDLAKALLDSIRNHNVGMANYGHNELGKVLRTLTKRQIAPEMRGLLTFPGRGK
jgi:hypothetical protein